MVNSLKRLNKIQVVSLILLVVSFILVCFNVNNSINFFWVSLGLNMLGYLMFITKWSREGKTGNRKFGTILGLFSMAFIWNFLSLAIVDRTMEEVELILKGGKKNGSK